MQTDSSTPRSKTKTDSLSHPVPETDFTVTTNDHFAVHIDSTGPHLRSFTDFSCLPDISLPFSIAPFHLSAFGVVTLRSAVPM